MMRKPEQTIGNLIDKQGVAFISSVDEESKEMIWQEGDTMYYPKGVTDPDYCVLRITIHSGRFYSR